MSSLDRSSSSRTAVAGVDVTEAVAATPATSSSKRPGAASSTKSDENRVLDSSPDAIEGASRLPPHASTSTRNTSMRSIGDADAVSVSSFARSVAASSQRRSGYLTPESSVDAVNDVFEPSQRAHDVPSPQQQLRVNISSYRDVGVTEASSRGSCVGALAEHMELSRVPPSDNDESQQSPPALISRSASAVPANAVNLSSVERDESSNVAASSCSRPGEASAATEGRVRIPREQKVQCDSSPHVANISRSSILANSSYLPIASDLSSSERSKSARDSGTVEIKSDSNSEASSEPDSPAAISRATSAAPTNTANLSSVERGEVRIEARSRIPTEPKDRCGSPPPLADISRSSSVANSSSLPVASQLSSSELPTSSRDAGTVKIKSSYDSGSEASYEPGAPATAATSARPSRYSRAHRTFYHTLHWLGESLCFMCYIDIVFSRYLRFACAPRGFFFSLVIFRFNSKY